MSEISERKRIWGWMFFDWASQPYNTLLLTFIFGPYFAEIVSTNLIAEGMPQDAAKARAQALWGYGLAATGITIAFAAPILGAFADSTGRRMLFIKLFALLYIVGSCGIWIADPDGFNVVLVLALFGIGFIGMEFSTIFTNALLPSLSSSEKTGEVSGTGFAFGYLGGGIALVIMLLLFAENSAGKTLLGNAPAFGLDPVAREGTRFVGPFSALWFILGMIPFFLWVREEPTPSTAGVKTTLADLARTIKSLPQRRSLFSFLGASLFYRDALNGLFGFGAIYAFGVLDWTVTDIGIFGIAGIISGGIFSYLGGQWDSKSGPKPVLVTSIIALVAVCVVVVSMTREQIFGIPFADGSSMPDIIFYGCGIVIGAAGGVLQASSRTMMVFHANPDRPAEAFGLYALSGKATAFLAPGLIAIASDLSGSQQIGVTPLIALFILGLVLLGWVKPKGDLV